MTTTISSIPGRVPQTPSGLANAPQAVDVDVTAADPAASAAGTAANPAAVTATNPAAPTAYSALTNLTNPVTKTEGEALSAALATLRGEVATYETAISALVVDVTAIRAEVVKLVTDMATRRTEINAVRAEVIKDLDDIQALIAALQGSTPTALMAS